MKLSTKTKQCLIGLAIGLLAGVIGLPLLGSPMLQAFEQRTMDGRMTFRGPAESAPEIVVCAIDAKSVNQLGQWPWPRSVMGDLVRTLTAAGAKSIAFDAIFSEPSRMGEEEDISFADAVEKAGNVVLGYYFTPSVLANTVPPDILPLPVEMTVSPPGGFSGMYDYPGIATNIPMLIEAAPLGGHFVVIPDKDGTVRRYSLVLQHEGDMYPSLALRAVQVFLGEPPIEVRPVRGVLPKVTLGDLEIPISELGELWVNYRGRYGETFPYYPIVDILSGEIPPEAFKDKLVFVGATETGIGDIKTTPFDATVPGVEMHTTVADNLLHRRFIRDGTTEALLSVLAMLLLGPLCGGAATVVRRPVIGAMVLAALLGLYLAFAQISFVVFSKHIFLFVPFLIGVVSYTGASIWRNVFSEAKAKQIRKTFSHFVSESVVSEMLNDPDRVRLGGEKRELTVLFSDIRGFTTLSEKLTPEEVVKVLNAYLTPMTKILLDRGGTLDKYMGDAIMAFFGAPVALPDHAGRACATALEMREYIGKLAAEWQAQGRPLVTSGAGISTGPMSVGNMGSDMIFDYTVIGDSVNLGARLEGLTRVYNVDIIVSEQTYEQAGADFCFRELDWVRVKGKVKPVTIFELMSTAERADEYKPLLGYFAAGLDAYRKNDFVAARAAFREADRVCPGDGPTATYLKRVEEFIVAPPEEDWAGVTSLLSK